MLTELALTHPCAEIVYWCSGEYLDRRRHPITQCPRCFFGVADLVSPVSITLLPEAA